MFCTNQRAVAGRRTTPHAAAIFLIRSKCLCVIKMQLQTDAHGKSLTSSTRSSLPFHRSFAATPPLHASSASVVLLPFPAFDAFDEGCALLFFFFAGKGCALLALLKARAVALLCCR